MMTEQKTALGCTVTTTFGQTKQALGNLPAGTLVEHVTLECTGAVDLKLHKPDRVRSWDWNR